MLNLDPDYLVAIKKILMQYIPHHKVWVYGSRIKGTSHQGSDLDLVIISSKDNPLSPEQLLLLQEAFSESDLPILIDISEWATLPYSFQQEIESNHEILYPN